MFKIGEEGLGRLAAEGKLALQNEPEYLEPLKEILLKKKIAPAEILMACFSKNLDKEERIKRIMACAAI